MRPKKFPFSDCGRMRRDVIKTVLYITLQLYRFTGESEYLLDQKECLRLGDFMRKTGKSLEIVE